MCNSVSFINTALTKDSAWACGHATLLFCVLRYGLSYITLNYNSKWAAFSYRTAFVAAVATYGIVVFKAYRARIRPGTPPLAMVQMLLSDENVQYLRKLTQRAFFEPMLTAYSDVFDLGKTSCTAYLLLLLTP